MRRFSCLAGFAVLTFFLNSSLNAQGSSPEEAVKRARAISAARTAALANNPDRVVELLDGVLTLNDPDGDMQFRYGRALLTKARFADAEKFLLASLPKGAFANEFAGLTATSIAECRAMQGDKEGAFRWLRKGIDDGVRSIQSIRVNPNFESLKADKRWEELTFSKDPSKMSRNEGLAYDIKFFHREIQRIHIRPNEKHTRKEFDDMISKLLRDLPKLSDAQVLVTLQRYTSMINDGHTRIFPPQDSVHRQRVPLQFFWFSDGIYVTLTDSANADVVGAKLIKVCGKTLTEIEPLFRAITSLDNEQGFASSFPIALGIPRLLNGLGINPDEGMASYTFELADGRIIERSIKSQASSNIDSPVTARDQSKNPVPLYLKNRSKAYWFEYLPDSKVLYLQYNAVQQDPREPMTEFAEKVFKLVNETDISALVLDVRWNGGGNSFLNSNLINPILKSGKFDARGKLFIITGRNTFSAAQNFTTDLGRLRSPIFVGEPTGSAPNFTGETVMVSLPYTKWVASISDLYWQRSWPMDYRKWISPDLYAPPTFSIFKENRDPAMEAIQAYLAGK